MHTTLFAVLASLSFVGTATCQTAAAVTYGTGCAYAGQNLAIGVQGLPQLGTTFTITYSGPNLDNTLTIQPILAVGLLPDSMPMPTWLLPQQPAGCTAWILPALFEPMPVASPGLFADHVAVAVPNDPGLTGFTLLAQWVAWVTQCGIVEPCTLEALPTSDAVALIVGT